jgi:hypothetical protein
MHRRRARSHFRATPRVHRWIALTTAAITFLLSSGGCASVPTPQTVTDVKQLAGLWRGSVPCRDCPGYLPATLRVRDDGTWSATVDRSSARAYDQSRAQADALHQASNLRGALGLVNGVPHWGQDGRWYGRATVVERRGYEYLSMLDANGDLWLEFQRAK